MQEHIRTQHIHARQYNNIYIHAHNIYMTHTDTNIHMSIHSFSILTLAGTKDLLYLSVRHFTEPSLLPDFSILYL